VVGAQEDGVTGGRIVHQVGTPWVYGWEGYAHGDFANVLLAEGA
jgi:hypothetical protein